MMPSYLQMAAVGIAALVCTTALAQKTVDRQKSCEPYSKLVLQAREARLAKNASKAIAIVEQPLKQSPDCYILNYSYGLSLVESGDPTKGATYLKKAYDLRERDNINDYAIYNSLGWAYLLKGEYFLAAEVFDKALNGEPWAKISRETQQRVLNNSGLLYLYMGRYDEAEKNLKQAANEYGSTLAKENLKRLEESRKRASGKR